MAESIQFNGESFAVAERIGAMPLMRFAKIAQGGVDANEMAGLAAIYDLLEQAVDPADWQRFCDHADKTRASGDELMTVVRDAITVLSARPTSRPSDSPGGPPTTQESSGGDSSSRAIARLEERGRPDLALIVSMANSA